MYNVRDIGGYPAAGDRATRWGVLLRSDSPHDITAEATSELLGMGVRTVIDLRATHEVFQDPNPFSASSDVTFHHLDMMGDALVDELSQRPAPRIGRASKLETYQAILDRRRPQVAETMALLAGASALPALVHCQAGQDRTGLVAALALSIAGVDGETIARDYALSAPYLVALLLAEAGDELSADAYTWERYQQEYCPPEAMLDTLGHIAERYGGAGRYLLGGGLTRPELDRLRDHILDNR